MTTPVINLNFEDRVIRAVRADGELLFVGKDVCKAMEVANPNEYFTKHCIQPVRLVTILDRLGREKHVRIMDVTDVLLLIEACKKPASPRLKKWLFTQVPAPETPTTKGKTA